MRAVFAVSAFILSPIVLGDNAALTSGGQPRMMKHHPQVRMVSEVVHLAVHKKSVDTDCSFVFENKGKACRVRMGFPDFGLWAYAYPAKKASSFFKTYRSYVNGKPVKTKLILGGEPGEQWQVKQIVFPANSKVLVREVYTTEIGGIGVKIPIASASYLLHTGASWNGPISDAIVTVTFDASTELTTPFQLRYTHPPQKLAPGSLDAQIILPGGMVAFGPSEPTILGRKVIYHKTNWLPTKDDDVLIFYRYPPKALAEAMAEERKH